MSSDFCILQDTTGEKTKVDVKAPNKKTPAAKPPLKPPKEKVVKPKKEVIKAGKLVKPDPTAKAKAVGHQPGVVRGITYYKAAKTSIEHGEGETQPSGVFKAVLSVLKKTLCLHFS